MEKAFEELEERVRRAAGLIKRLREEKDALHADAQQLRQRVKQAEGQSAAAQKARPAQGDESRLQALQEEVRDLRQERDEVRSRISRLLEVLNGLE